MNRTPASSHLLRTLRRGLHPRLEGGRARAALALLQPEHPAGGRVRPPADLCPPAGRGSGSEPRGGGAGRGCGPPVAWAGLPVRAPTCLPGALPRLHRGAAAGHRSPLRRPRPAVLRNDARHQPVPAPRAAPRARPRGGGGARRRASSTAISGASTLAHRRRAGGSDSTASATVAAWPASGRPGGRRAGKPVAREA